MTRQTKIIYDTIIIGAGPAGLNTALYTGRSMLNTLIIEQGLTGGQLNNTTEVENYLGVAKLSGMEIAEQMTNQALEFGAEQAFGQVIEIKKVDELFHVTTNFEETYVSKTVVYACGTEHRKLGVAGELEYNGRGVSYCAICDGAFFKDGQIIVVGGGDSALEEGEYLTSYGKKVSLVHRRKELRGDISLQTKFEQQDNSEFILDAQITNIVGDGQKVTGVEITNNDGTVQTLEADGVFVYVGLDPLTSVLTGFNVLDTNGYVQTNERMETSVKGLYAVGDVRVKELRQLATAVSDGAIAGTEIYKYLNK